MPRFRIMEGRIMEVLLINNLFSMCQQTPVCVELNVFVCGNCAGDLHECKVHAQFKKIGAQTEGYM